MPIDFLLIKTKAWVENSKSVNTEDPETLKKITTKALQMGVGAEELIAAVNANVYLKMMFAKDPSKQNIYEIAELKFLQTIPHVKSAVKIEAAGNKAVYVDRGVLSVGESGKTTRRGSKSKSIDFKIVVLPKGQRTKVQTIYAMHKYTESEGGAQDNQRQDIITYLENAPLERAECFVALLDGEYYTKKLAGLKAEFDVVGHRRVLTSNEFESVVVGGTTL